MRERKSMIDTAKDIASGAHEGQVDKLGAAYIGHPARVAGHARDLGGSPEAIAAAWLHDVIEDCDVSAADLRAAGIPDTVIVAVELLSKRPGQSLQEYCAGVRGNALALLVKEADLADNTDPERTSQLDQATRQRLAKKYQRTRSLLGL
ncbi:MAG: HD domain-containing protein [Glutamicibacter sp.]|uniref:HD domain-containing protein n=2 Tax=Glutamicibacter TaxID=1742989 RepID=UPI002FCA2B5D